MKKDTNQIQFSHHIFSVRWCNNSGETEAVPGCMICLFLYQNTIQHRQHHFLQLERQRHTIFRPQIVRL